MAAFVLPWQSWVIATETKWSAKLRIFTVWPFTQKVAYPCFWGLLISTVKQINASFSPGLTLPHFGWWEKEHLGPVWALVFVPADPLGGSFPASGSFLTGTSWWRLSWRLQGDPLQVSRAQSLEQLSALQILATWPPWSSTLSPQLRQTSRLHLGPSPSMVAWELFRQEARAASNVWKPQFHTYFVQVFSC